MWPSSPRPASSGLTSTDGAYSIFVPPDQYNVAALPLAGIYDIANDGGRSCGYSENSPSCCDPATDSTCTGKQLSPPANYSGKFK